MDGENTNPTPQAPGDGGQGQAPQSVTLSVQEYEALKGAAQTQHAEKLTYEQRVEKIEKMYQAEKVSAALGDVLAGAQFVSQKAAAQAKQILAGRAEVRTENGVAVVYDRETGKPFTEAAAAALQSGDFAHFLAPIRGGSGATNPPPPGAGSYQADDWGSLSRQFQEIHARSVIGQNPMAAALAKLGRG